MGFLISPTTNDVSPVAGGNTPAARLADRLLRHFVNGPRGRHVVKSGGVYTTYDVLTQVTIDAADNIFWPDGSYGPAIFLGGHRTEVTASEGAALTAAGYTVT